MKVYTRNIDGHRVLNYVYVANSEMAFHFHLLSEVGMPWLKEAGRMARELASTSDSVIIQVELDQKPWYVDALIKRSEQ